MNNQIRKLRKGTDASFFPSIFSNEVYHSKTDGFEPFTYITNLTIKYVDHGYDYYKVNGHEIKLKAKQFLIINAGNEVSCYSDAQHEGMSIFINPDILNEVYTSLINPENAYYIDSSNEINFHEFPHFCNNSFGQHLEFLFQQARQSTHLDEFDSSETFFYSLAKLMLSYHQDLSHKIQQVPRLNKAVKQELYKRVMLAKYFIEENFKNKITLDAVAQEACLSKFYLIKCFSAIYGVTPYEFLLKKRIKSAKRELRLQKSSITDIAIANGFENISAFSKRFKKVEQVSPLAYQKLHGS